MSLSVEGIKRKYRKHRKLRRKNTSLIAEWNSNLKWKPVYTCVYCSQPAKSYTYEYLSSEEICHLLHADFASCYLIHFPIQETYWFCHLCNETFNKYYFQVAKELHIYSMVHYPPIMLFIPNVVEMRNAASLMEKSTLLLSLRSYTLFGTLPLDVIELMQKYILYLLSDYVKHTTDIKRNHLHSRSLGSSHEIMNYITSWDTDFRDVPIYIKRHISPNDI